MPTDDLSYHAGLSDLLDSDLSAWEFYSSLPDSYRRKIQERDISSFSDLQDYTAKLREQD